MEENNNKKHGFILEDENFYVTKDRKFINVEKFKEQCIKYRIYEWRKELEKL